MDKSFEDLVYAMEELRGGNHVDYLLKDEYQTIPTSQAFVPSWRVLRALNLLQNVKEWFEQVRVSTK